jgi:hypothetical protein
MDTAPQLGSIELRRAGGGAVRLSGRFPYNVRATISAGGNGRRPRKEMFAPRAFSYALEQDREVHFLAGHSFDRPLASRKAGTLDLTDTDEALLMEATLTPEVQETSWTRDFLAALRAGLVVGLSPGFRVAPPEAVPDAQETVEEDPAEGNALIRIIRAAVLFEISAVTRPAYEDAALEEEERAFVMPTRRLLHPAERWR